MRFGWLVVMVACGSSQADDAQHDRETTGGSATVTDEAWEQSAWEPEPAQPETDVTWTFDEWQERLRDLAETHGCLSLDTVPGLETGVGAYIDEESADSLVEAHEALSRALREWGVECHASTGEPVIERAVSELCGQLEKITSERLDSL